MKPLKAAYAGVSIAQVRRVWRAFGPSLAGLRLRIAEAAGLAMGTVALELLRPWPLKFLFDRVLVTDGAPSGVLGLGSDASLVLLGATVLLVSVLIGLAQLRTTVVIAQISRTAIQRLRRQVFGHMHRIALPFHQSRRTGDLVMRLMSDVNMMRDILFVSWLILFERGLLLVATAAIMLTIDPMLALVALAPLPLLWVSVGRGTRTLREVSRKQRRREGKAAALAAESLRQIRIVKAYAAESRATDLFARQARSGERAEMKGARIRARMSLTTEVLTGIGLAVVLLVGGRAALQGRVSVGDLIVFTSYARTLYKPLRQISNQGGRLAKATACAGRLMEVLEVAPEEDSEGREPPDLAGRIVFDDVHYRYPGGVEALRGLSFRLEPGTLAVLSGPNGSGKSTALSILLRLVKPDAGSVLIDNEPIDELRLSSYRAQFAYVPQDILLFGASLRENILYGRPDAPDDDVEAAARVALFDDVVTRVGGYDVVLGENGASLSGGEARRLMLARAALRKARVLLLDEPLAGVDADAQPLVAQAIRRIAAGRTTIVVHHGPTDDFEPDVVLQLQDGRLAEQKSAEEARAGSVVGNRPETPAWAAVGDLAGLLDEASATDFFTAAGLSVTRAVPDHLRLTSEHALVGLHITSDEGLFVGYIRTYRGDGAAEIASKWAGRAVPTALGPGVRLLRGGRSVLFVFPNDHRVRALRRFAYTPRLVRSLLTLPEIEPPGEWVSRRRSTLTPMRYKPERRLVARLELAIRGSAGERHRSVVVRIFGRGHEWLARDSEKLHAALGSFVARPLGAVEDGLVLAEEHVEGEGLPAALRSGRLAPAAAAEVLAAVHSSPVALSVARTADDVAASALDALGVLGRVAPASAPLIDEVATLLARFKPSYARVVPVHGDLHLGQMLVTGDGPVLVDFEGSGMGHPLHDVGFLVAHLRADGHDGFAAAFLDEYLVSYRGDVSALAFYVGCGLAERALLSFRMLASGWEAEVERLMTMARTELTSTRASETTTEDDAAEPGQEVPALERPSRP